MFTRHVEQRNCPWDSPHYLRNWLKKTPPDYCHDLTPNPQSKIFDGHPMILGGGVYRRLERSGA